MKYIKRKSAVRPITGSIVDTTNIDDKTSNTYSARVIEELVKDVYSTSETVVGTWIDGKPIYRKVINFNIPSGANTNWYGAEILQDTTIETMVTKKCEVWEKNHYGNCTLPRYGNGNLTELVFTHNKILGIYDDGTFSGGTGTAIIEYTKTTD